MQKKKTVNSKGLSEHLKENFIDCKVFLSKYWKLFWYNTHFSHISIIQFQIHCGGCKLQNLCFLPKIMNLNVNWNGP